MTDDEFPYTPLRVTMAGSIPTWTIDGAYMGHYRLLHRTCSIAFSLLHCLV
jgi:hypothetical protein